MVGIDDSGTIDALEQAQAVEIIHDDVPLKCGHWRIFILRTAYSVSTLTQYVDFLVIP